MGNVDQALGLGAPWAHTSLPHLPPDPPAGRGARPRGSARLGAGFRQREQPRKTEADKRNSPHCETVVQDDCCVPDTQGAGLTPRHRLPRTRPAPFMNPRSTSTVEDGSPLLRAGKPRRSRSRTATLPDSKAALVAEWTLTVTFGVFIHNLTTAATIRSVQRHHPHAEHCVPRSRPRARV